ncbi:transcriptional regulator family: bZIP [Paecilomyces variotii]|nr:transcriptional regulator family: bZIP [Paecilomyces variotii]
MGKPFDTASDSSNPSSPTQMMYHGGIHGTYDMMSLSHVQSAVFAPANPKIPVQYTGQTTSHERDRRKKASPSEKPELVTNMHLQRRRAQNRASQRAFRERKEKHVKGLENQLRDLHEKHQALINSYSRQADEVRRLNERIKSLLVELDILRTNEASLSESLFPDKYDVFPYPQALYAAPEPYYDMKLNATNVRFGYPTESL